MTRSRRKSMEGFATLLLWFSFFSISIISSAVDTITAPKFIRDGDTIVSTDGNFELGFFSPNNSANRFVGIWYKKISKLTVVWVANRDIPLVDSSGILKVTDGGILTVINGNDSIIWSSNSTRFAQNPFAQLLDSGNLVVRNGNDYNPENFLWQSFDYPCDTILPGMKFGINLETGLDRYLTSWKGSNDPSKGDYTARFDPRGLPEVVVMKDSVEQFRSGPWNGLCFSGMPNVITNQDYTYNFVFNGKEIYFSYELLDSRVVLRVVLDHNGRLQGLTWINQSHGWSLSLTAQTDNCDNYAACGVYGSCNGGNLQQCGCVTGFVPKFPKEWEVADWSNGCVRRTQLDCQNGDGFLKYSGIKLPATRNSWFNRSMILEECKMECLKNCSCVAYANLEIRKGGSGCLLWFGDLIDIKEFNQNGQDIYIRLASSEIGQLGSSKKKKLRYIAGSVLLAVMLLLGLSLTLCLRRKNKLQRQGRLGHNLERNDTTECQKDPELPLFNYATIANATDNFSVSNKLGEGGFGPVYKGKLEDGQEIAVKRLSKNSRQGADEFKNEVFYIAKLQHRNLVKLIGYCIQGEEKMLIYEYMPNNSLDSFIFDQSRKMFLDWPKRFHIINGIARGLLYLHQDSRLRIIHRDLKVSNILLDFDMNPKISDFGLARSFVGSETEANTKRVVGTYGYMSPEYTIDGLFSVKSDVFSFGVMVLEIVSGKRNRGFCHPDHCLTLLGHAWKLYKEGRSSELIDAPIEDSCNRPELLRSILVGLLCVQQCPEDRPNMSTAVVMLTSEGLLPRPKQPGFFNERNVLEADLSTSKCEPCSANMVTVTELEAR